VLIVGGSLVGLSTTLFPTKAGTTPLLVERHAGTAVHLRVASLTARTMEIFRSVGADTALRQIDPRSRTASVVPLVESLVGAEVENRMEDMRSPRVLFDTVASGHWPSHRLAPAVHEYPRCWILMRQEEPAPWRRRQDRVQAAR